MYALVLLSMFGSEIPIQHIDVNKGRYITVLIPQKCLKDKKEFEHYIINFSDKVNIHPQLILNIVQDLKLSQNQTHLAIKGRNNGKILELWIGVLSRKVERYDRGFGVFPGRTLPVYRIEYVLGWNIKLD